MACGCCNNDSGENYGYVGSDLKWAVSMTCEGFDMNENDWKIIVSRGPKHVEFTKDNAIYDEQADQWYICVDTTAIGPGKAIITFVAYVPDSDVNGGIRTEIAEYDLVNIRRLQTSGDITPND